MNPNDDKPPKEIFLTFDDGPSEDTLNVLAILKKYDAKATFFLVGKMIVGRESIIEAVKADGHQFGNHTFSHKRLWFKPKSFIEEEIKKCDAELERVGIKTNLFRFPGLKYGPNALNVCKKLQKKIVSADQFSWNQNAYDWYQPWLKKQGFIKGEVKTDLVVRKTLNKVKNGTVLVFHDYLQEIGPNPELITILEKLLPELVAHGFKFTTIK